MKRFLICLVFCLFCLPGPAGAVTLVNPDGTPAHSLQRWADASRIPQVSGIIVVRGANECGYEIAPLGCASPEGWIATDGTRWTTLHELGHVRDFTMPDWVRQTYVKIRGAWSVEGWADDFAECAIFKRQPEGSGMDSGRQFRRVCRLLRQPF